VAFVEQAGVRSLVSVQVPQIQQFFTQFQAQKPATRLTYAVSLRTFLRWAYQEGLLPTDLRAAVIGARHMRHVGLRDVLSEEEITRIVTAVDRSSPVGRRDYAVLLLAARYGMRPSDIRRLQLDNVQWRAGVIAIRQAKTGGPLVLPLLTDVRAALIAYLRDGRPSTQAREVFVRHRAPFEPFVANNLSAIMHGPRPCSVLISGPAAAACISSGTPWRRGCSPQSAQSKHWGVLGHVSTDTTMEHANVDLTP
jgi:integrase